MKIGIIGAGWFGCHIASELMNDGHEVYLYERQKDIFLGASGNNQNRLHLGYHYPRSHLTREQSKKGFKLFKKYYPSFSSKIKNNFYAISKDKRNILDFETFLQILKASKLPFTVMSAKKFKIKNVSGLIKCDEEYINVAKAKSFFLKKFKNKIKFNKDIKIIKNKNNQTLIDNKSYDFIINTTWQQFKPSNKWDLSYELCISLLYKSKKNISNAITIMDGPFLTLYPWSKTKFNLYSVKYSRYLKSKNFYNLKHKINKIKRKDFLKIKQLMENEFIKYLPDFRKKYRFLKYISTFRTLIEKKNDSRDYQIEFKNNVFNILSGKVDHIFLASKDIKKCIKNFS